MTQRRGRVFTRPLAVRLEEKTWDDLRGVADALGTTPTQLMRDWIVERLAVAMAAGAGRLSGDMPPALEAEMREEIIRHAMAVVPEIAAPVFERYRGEIIEESLHRRDLDTLDEERAEVVG